MKRFSQIFDLCGNFVMTVTINIWFLDDVCRKAGGIRCNGRDKCSDILRMMNFIHNTRYSANMRKYCQDCLYVNENVLVVCAA